MVERLITAGQWHDGDRDVLIVTDAGHDVMRLAWLLSDPKGGRPPKHGPQLRLAKPETWPEPAVVTMNDTPRYGKAETRAWDRVHPRLTHRSAWIDLDGELPLVEGTLIRARDRG